MKETTKINKKIKTSFLILFLISFLLNSSNLNGYENKIIFKVGSGIITSIDLKNEINYLTALNPNLKKLKNQEIFKISKKSLINEKIKMIEISRNFENTKMPEDILNKFIKNIYIKIGFSDLKSFKNYLKSNKVNYENVKKKIQIEALWNELIIAKFSNKVTIDEARIREQVKKNLNKKTKFYLLSEILFELSKDENLNEKYEKILQSIDKNGFDNSALKYSISETSQIGGKLDWINEESLNKKIKNLIRPLKINKFTKPISVPGGFLILQVNDLKVVQSENNYEEETRRMIGTLKNNQLKQFSKLYFNKIKKNMEIDEI